MHLYTLKFVEILIFLEMILILGRLIELIL